MLVMQPARVVFVGKLRTIQGWLMNNGDMPVRYKISILPEYQGTAGEWSTEKVPPAYALQVKKMIRYSPRRATVPAQQQQTIKLMLRKPKDLPPGEYRARMLISPLPPRENGHKKEEESGGKSSAAVTVLVSTSFPMIILHDVAPGDVTLTSLKLRKNPNKKGWLADIGLSRSGKISAFGQVQIWYTPAGGGERMIGKLRKIAFYSPEKDHNSTVVLKNISDVELRSGSLRVMWFPEYLGQRGQVKATAERSYNLRNVSLGK
jgi:hypothetical protein